MSKTVFRITSVVLCVAFLAAGLLVVGAFRYYAKTTDTTETTTYRLNTAVNADTVPEVSGKTYYVDAAAAGGNDGLSPERALKTLEEVNNLSLGPGDQVLFKRNCRWNGQLKISASGTKDAPISFSVYGQGEYAPVLDGCGLVSATVTGTDVSHIRISNLEIANQTKTRVYYLRGISFTAVNKNVEDIQITDNYVHDVDSDVSGAVSKKGMFNIGAAWLDFHWYGGIVVKAGNYGQRDDKVKLDNIVVEGNRVERVCVEGIMIGSATKAWERSTNITVRNNYVQDAGGESITLFSCNDSLIEGNVSESGGQIWNIGGIKSNFVGVMTIYCKNILVQYNEIFDQQPCVDDGQGFDADDTCEDIIIQYNYFHDNANGAIMLYNMVGNGHSIIRYNISQNDGGPFLTVACRDSSTLMKATSDIYNNVCFTNRQITEMIEIAPDVHMRAAENKALVLKIKNNIFYNKGSKGLSALNNDLYHDYMDFSHNCWYGFSERTLPQYEVGQIIGDPKFTYPGSGTLGLTTLSGYQLLKDSPCLNAGIPVYNDGGLDFFGNKIGDDINIGAYIGAAALKPANVNLALNQPVKMSSINAIAMMRDTSLAKITDGSAAENVSTKPGAEATAETWFEVDLGDSYAVSKVILKTAENASLFPEDYTVGVWDGKDWVEAARVKGAALPTANGSVQHEFREITGSKIRVNVTKMRADNKGKFAAELAEIEAYQVGGATQ